MTEEASELADLIEAALLHLDDEEPDFDGPPTGWRAVSLLQRRTDAATLAAALALCDHADEKRRRVGAAILGQLGHPSARGGVFRDARYDALEKLLLTEIATTAQPKVLADACFALGHLHDPRAIPQISRLLAHPDADVRYAVVAGLSRYQNDAAIAGLCALTRDSDSHVRDWATFELGQLIDTDTAPIRAALHARLDDADPDVRNEAIAGLARRKDTTILPALIRELGIQVATPLFEAACELAEPALCPALTAARTIGQPWPNHVKQDWLEAMAACGCAVSDATAGPDDSARQV